MIYRHRLHALRHSEQQHRAAMHRMRECELMVHGPTVAPITELALLLAGGEAVANELAKLEAAKRELAQACLPLAVAECERTAKRVRAAEYACEAEAIRQEEAEQRAAELAAVVRAELLRLLPSDHLSEACAASSERKRKRTHNTTDCTRRAACVGTSAPAAPPAAVGNRQATAHSCADQSGVAPPM